MGKTEPPMAVPRRLDITHAGSMGPEFIDESERPKPKPLLPMKEPREWDCQKKRRSNLTQRRGAG